MARATNGNITTGGGTHEYANFTDEEINLALKVQELYNVPASVTLGQYALESGYGEHTVGKNNYFNIKGSGTGGYRDYNSKEESFMDFGRLLTKERYTSPTNSATTVQEYVQGVKNGGYAEDPNYVSKVMNIINSNNLTRLDTGDYSATTTTLTRESGGHYVKAGLEWWGDIVRVVIILLLIGGGVVLLAVSLNNIGFDVPSVSKVVKGVSNGN